MIEENSYQRVTYHEHHPGKCNPGTIRAVYLATFDDSQARLCEQNAAGRDIQLDIVPVAYWLPVEVFARWQDPTSA